MKIEKIILAPGEKKPERCVKCRAYYVCDYYYSSCHVVEQNIPDNCTDHESLDNTVQSE